MALPNLPIKNVTGIIDSLKGKKPLVIIVSAVVIILGALAVKFGYIPQELLNTDYIISTVNNVFTSDTTKAVIDSKQSARFFSNL